MSRILITGAAGFIGAHLVGVARARGHHVIALTRRTPCTAPASEHYSADLTNDDIAALLTATRPEIVINAASYGIGPEERDPARALAVNTVGAHRLLLAAKVCAARRFIQLGTYSEYGDHPESITEHTPLTPKDSYGATKAAASLLVTASGVAEPVETIVLRLFNVWGPGERPHRLLQRVIHHCRTNTRLALTPGNQGKDWCYVADVAAWIFDIAQHAAPYRDRVVNVAGGERCSVRDMAIRAARALRGEHLLDFGAVPVPPGEAQTGPANLERINALLPTRRMTPVDVAIAQTVEATS